MLNDFQKFAIKNKIFNALDFGKLKRILRNKADLPLKLASEIF